MSHLEETKEQKWKAPSLTEQIKAKNVREKDLWNIAALLVEREERERWDKICTTDMIFVNDKLLIIDYEEAETTTDTEVVKASISAVLKAACEGCEKSPSSRFKAALNSFDMRTAKFAAELFTDDFKFDNSEYVRAAIRGLRYAGGEEKLLPAVKQALSDRVPLLYIHGDRGSGKTALLMSILFECHPFPLTKDITYRYLELHRLHVERDLTGDPLWFVRHFNATCRKWKGHRVHPVDQTEPPKASLIKTLAQVADLRRVENDQKTLMLFGIEDIDIHSFGKGHDDIPGLLADQDVIAGLKTAGICCVVTTSKMPTGSEIKDTRVLDLHELSAKGDVQAFIESRFRMTLGVSMVSCGVAAEQLMSLLRENVDRERPYRMLDIMLTGQWKKLIY